MQIQSGRTIPLTRMRNDDDTLLTFEQFDHLSSLVDIISKSKHTKTKSVNHGSCNCTYIVRVMFRWPNFIKCPHQVEEATWTQQLYIIWMTFIVCSKLAFNFLQRKCQKIGKFVILRYYIKNLFTECATYLWENPAKMHEKNLPNTV
jgi:hypothetical protein